MCSFVKNLQLNFENIISQNLNFLIDSRNIEFWMLFNTNPFESKIQA